MIVSCQGCGTRFRHAKVEPSHAKGECSVCHSEVPLIAPRKPYLLVQSGLNPVAIGMDDPSLAAGLSTAGAALEAGSLQPFQAEAPFAGDTAGPMDEEFPDASEAVVAAESAETAEASSSGAVGNLFRFALPTAGLGAAAYYLSGPMDLTAAVGGAPWMWAAGAAAFGAIVGFALVRWNSKKV